MADGEQSIQELVQIIDYLQKLERSCERVRQEYNVLDATRTQTLLQEFAASLAYLPKSIQLLHDFKRFTQDYDQRVQQVYKGLVSARKSDSALSSEEERVIAAVASLVETLESSIQHLEYVFNHLRNSTQMLVAVIAHNDSGFEEFASKAFDQLNIKLIHEASFEEHQRMKQLHRDIGEIHSLEEHIKNLQS